MRAEILGSCNALLIYFVFILYMWHAVGWAHLRFEIRETALIQRGEPQPNFNISRKEQKEVQIQIHAPSLRSGYRCHFDRREKSALRASLGVLGVLARVNLCA